MSYSYNKDWYKHIKKDEIWVKKTKNKNYFDSLKIISFLNLKRKKRIKVERPDGKRISVEPGCLFYNYQKKGLNK